MTTLLKIETEPVPEDIRFLFQRHYDCNIEDTGRDDERLWISSRNARGHPLTGCRTEAGISNYIIVGYLYAFEKIECRAQITK
jgi:hypothetical protein